MRPSEALTRKIDTVRAIIARYPVSNPRVFGSVARGDDHEGSDIDILVDATERTSLFDIGGLQADLQKCLGVSVDVTTSGSLRQSARDSAFRDSRPL